jgi:hypothetical protein
LTAATRLGADDAEVEAGRLQRRAGDEFAVLRARRAVVVVHPVADVRPQRHEGDVEVVLGQDVEVGAAEVGVEAAVLDVEVETGDQRVGGVAVMREADAELGLVLAVHVDVAARGAHQAGVVVGHGAVHGDRLEERAEREAGEQVGRAVDAERGDGVARIDGVAVEERRDLEDEEAERAFHAEAGLVSSERVAGRGGRIGVAGLEMPSQSIAIAR